MADRVGDPSGYTADLEEIEREALRLQRALTEARGTAESADGLVQATVGGRCELVELVLDPRIYRVQDAAALAEDISTAIRKAAARAREQVLVAANPLLPANSGPDAADPEFGPFLAELDRMKGRSTP